MLVLNETDKYILDGQKMYINYLIEAANNFEDFDALYALDLLFEIHKKYMIIQ